MLCSCVPGVKRASGWRAGRKQSGSDGTLNNVIAMVSVRSPSQHGGNSRHDESLWRDSDRHEGERMKKLEEICLTV